MHLHGRSCGSSKQASLTATIARITALINAIALQKQELQDTLHLDVGETEMPDKDDRNVLVDGAYGVIRGFFSGVFMW